MLLTCEVPKEDCQLSTLPNLEVLPQLHKEERERSQVLLSGQFLLVSGSFPSACHFGLLRKTFLITNKKGLETP
jgi:hypothetical protein